MQLPDLKFNIEEKRKKLYQKALLLFFAFMVVCTVISRAADSMTVPWVTVQTPGSGRITYQLSGSGTIEASLKKTQLVPEGCLIEQCVPNGSYVEKDSVLVQFQLEYLMRKQQEMETELAQKKLQLEQERLGLSGSSRVPEQDAAQRALEKAQAGINQAAADGQQAQAQYNQALQALNQRLEEGKAQALQKLEEQKAKEISRKKEEEKAAEKQDGQENTGEESTGEENTGEEKTGEGNSGEGEGAASGNQQDARKTAQEEYDETIRQLTADYDAQKAQLDAALSDAQNASKEAGKNLEQAQDSYESALKNDAASEKNEAKEKERAALSVKSLEMDVKNAEKKRDDISALVSQEGKIYAAESGTVLNAGIAEGTVTTGSELVRIGTGDFTFTALIPQKEQENLAAGDQITIKIPGKEEIEVPITQMIQAKEQEAEENGTGEAMLRIDAALPQDTYTSGMYVTFSVRKDSEEQYRNTLPLTAVRQDSKGYFCLGIREKSSILGRELAAERIELTLLDKDGTTAAVDGTLQSDTKIITGSEKDVQEGDRVRIEE